MIPIYAEYHYPVQNATEYHYYVHGDSTNYSPANITVYQGAPPSFVKDVSIPSSDKAYEFGTLPHSHLLNDKQFDIATMTVFHRFAYKIWNTFDAELFSNLEISFKPAQKLTMHSCSVLRNGSLINKLDMKELRVIQREEELDQLIYEEDMSAILFLEDIRIGDLLEYSYSISNIFSFDWPFAYHLPLQFSHRWEKSYYRIIKEPNHTYRIRHLPEKWSSYLTENDRELVWQIEPALPYVFEYDQPPGYCPYASAEISELGNWNELVRQEIDFYRIDPAFANDPEVIDLISNWKMNGASAQEKACLALRFVQDEIRYMGLEDGLKGMTPSDPLVTLKRRFGDCKGKTQLFRAFLLALDIPSKPVQVDTEDQKEIKNHLPIPIFNHVIARVDLPDQSIYVDPTQINQGGELKDSYLPYGFGLVISPETQDLTPIPEPLVHPEIEGSTTLMIHDDEVEMSLKTQFYGKKANKWRNRIQIKGRQAFSDRLVNNLENQFGSVRTKDLVHVDDDRAHNHISASASFQLPDALDNEEKILIFTPLFISQYFDQEIDIDRTTPLYIPHERIKETIHVVGGEIATSSTSIENDTFTLQVHATEDCIEYDLMTHVESIAPDQLETLATQLQEAIFAMQCIILPPSEK